MSRASSFNSPTSSPISCFDSPCSLMPASIFGSSSPRNFWNFSESIIFSITRKLYTKKSRGGVSEIRFPQSYWSQSVGGRVVGFNASAPTPPPAPARVAYGEYLTSLSSPTLLAGRLYHFGRLRPPGTSSNAWNLRGLV